MTDQSRTATQLATPGRRDDAHGDRRLRRPTRWSRQRFEAAGERPARRYQGSGRHRRSTGAASTRRGDLLDSIARRAATTSIPPDRPTSDVPDEYGPRRKEASPCSSPSPAQLGGTPAPERGPDPLQLDASTHLVPHGVGLVGWRTRPPGRGSCRSPHRAAPVGLPLGTFRRSTALVGRLGPPHLRLHDREHPRLRDHGPGHRGVRAGRAARHPPRRRPPTSGCARPRSSSTRTPRRSSRSTWSAGSARTSRRPAATPTTGCSGWTSTTAATARRPTRTSSRRSPTGSSSATFEEFLRQVWRAIENADNFLANNPTDFPAIAGPGRPAAEHAHRPARRRRDRPNLSREEFLAVCLAALAGSHPVRRHRRSCATSRPPDRARRSGCGRSASASGLPAHGRSHSYFIIASRVSNLLTAHRAGRASTPAPEPRPSRPPAASATWSPMSSTTGR